MKSVRPSGLHRQSAGDAAPPQARANAHDTNQTTNLNILCLHGHGANNHITALQTRYLRLTPNQGVNADLLAASLETRANDATLAALSPGPYHSWFRFDPLSLFHGIGRDNGSLLESLRRIIGVIREHGPYDGVYGFSQGATVAAMLCSETCWRHLGGLSEPPFRFAILANAGATWALHRCSLELADKSHAHASLPLTVPSLHLIGEKDRHKGESQRLVQAFAPKTEPLVYAHKFGHELPLQIAGDAALYPDDCR